MLKVISWNQYFIFMGVVTLGWYAYVLLRYSISISKVKDMSFSPADRTGLFVNDLPDAQKEEPISRSDLDAQPTQVEHTPQGNLVMQTVTQEIRTVIREAADEGISDAELAARLRVILANYPDLEDTAFGITVNDFIMREAKAVGFNLTKEEVVSFWE